MRNYYNIFNLGLAKQKGIITDEMVEKVYLNMKEQYLKFQEKNTKNGIKNKKVRASEEVRIIQEGNYLEELERAYNAIRTQEKRMEYDAFLKEEEYKTDEKKSINSQATSAITKKAEAFNELLRNYVSKIPKEYLKTESKEREIDYTPIYKGKYCQRISKKDNNGRGHSDFSGER